VSNCNRQIIIKRNTNNTNIQIIQNDNRNIDNRHIDNRQIITNNIIIVRPLGYETIENIPKDEMIRILMLGSSACIEITNVIYSNIANKNFFKDNLGNNSISFLTKSYGIKVLTEKEFCNYLFNNCNALLYHMLYVCKDDLEPEAILQICNNIESIKDTINNKIQKELYDSQFRSIVKTEIRNNNKTTRQNIKLITDLIKKDNDIQNITSNIINNHHSINNNIDNSLKRSITDQEYEIHVGNLKNSAGVQSYNNKLPFLQCKEIEDTPCYKSIMTQINNEIEFVYSRNDYTIGDIINLHKRINKYKLKLNSIKEIHSNIKPTDNLILDIFSYHSNNSDNISNTSNNTLNDEINPEEEVVEPFQCDIIPDLLA
jgi:hypothetical protein